MLIDGLLSADSSASADKIKELKRKILDLEKDNVAFKENNQVLKGKEDSLESLVASKNQKDSRAGKRDGSAGRAILC